MKRDWERRGPSGKLLNQTGHNTPVDCGTDVIAAGNCSHVLLSANLPTSCRGSQTYADTSVATRLEQIELGGVMVCTGQFNSHAQKVCGVQPAVAGVFKVGNVSNLQVAGNRGCARSADTTVHTPLVLAQ